MQPTELPPLRDPDDRRGLADAACRPRRDVSTSSSRCAHSGAGERDVATRNEELHRYLAVIDAALAAIHAGLRDMRAAVERSEAEVRGDLEERADLLLRRLDDLYTEVRHIATQSEKDRDQLLVLGGQLEQLTLAQRLGEATSREVVEAVDARARDEIITATIRRTDEITARHRLMAPAVEPPAPAAETPSAPSVPSRARLRSAVARGFWPLLVAGGLVAIGGVLLDRCRAPTQPHSLVTPDMHVEDLADSRPPPPPPQLPPAKPKRPRPRPKPSDGDVQVVPKVHAEEQRWRDCQPGALPLDPMLCPRDAAAEREHLPGLW